LGAPLADSPRFWAPLWPTRLAFCLETPSIFPTAPLSLFFRFCWLGAPLDHSLRFWALLLTTRFGFGRSSCLLSRVPSGNPKFFPHRTSVVVSFGLLGWALLLPTRLGFVCPFRQLALCCLWKPQVFSQVGSPLANSPGLAFGEPRVFPHMSCVPDSSILFCWIWHFVRGVT